MILSLKDWENLKTRCINERIKMSVPKLILNLVVIIHSIYMIYQAFYKQKWDKELRKEYVAFVIVIIFCKHEFLFYFILYLLIFYSFIKLHYLFCFCFFLQYLFIISLFYYILYYIYIYIY